MLFSKFYLLFILINFKLILSQEKFDCNKEITEEIKEVCEEQIFFIKLAEDAENSDPKYKPNATEGIAPSRPELECVNQSCVCHYYGGNIKNSNCILQNGQKVQKAIRKELRMLTDQERTDIFNAIREMKERGDYDYIALIHRLAFVSGGAHYGPAFFVWHREYMKRFEILLRKRNPTLALPYWDSTLDGRLPTPADSILFSDDFLGTTNSQGYVVTGPFSPWPTIEGYPNISRNVGKDGSCFSEYDIQWTVSQTKIENVLAYTSARRDCPVRPNWRWFEYPHGNPHLFIGGDMATFIPNRPANDPIFFFYHCFVDLVFELWRKKAQNRNQRANDYPADLSTCESESHFKHSNMTQFAPLQNWDGLRNEYTDNMFEYAPRPFCTLEKECNSKYLFCDRSHSFPPLCVSKVRLGGNCKGFINGEEVCLNGNCVDNICVINTTKTTIKPEFVSSTLIKNNKSFNTSTTIKTKFY